MNRLFTFLILAFFLACRQQQQNVNQVLENESPVPVAVPPPLDLTAILSRISVMNSIVDTGAMRVYEGRISAHKFALLQNSDSSFIVCQQDHAGVWQTTDTFPYPIFAVEQSDLNGDSNKDLIVTGGIIGNAGNSVNVCLMYDAVTSRFKHNPNFELPNVHFDRKHHLVISSWFGSVTHPQEINAYKMDGDSLLFYKSMILDPGDEPDESRATLLFYAQKQGEKILVGKKTGSYEQMERIFLNTWDIGRKH